ncbi:reverse transcriptase domain-containing protein [Tanacetum coccineum]
MAPLPGRALFDRLLGEIRAFSQHENESLTDAWLRMKEILRNCHGHNLSKGNIIKIFYHGLNEITQEVLNATVGGIFLYKTPNQAYQLIEDKFDRLADKQSGRPSRSLPSNTQPNPRGKNSKSYQPPQSRNKHVNSVFTRSGKSFYPPVNPNCQQNNSETPINFDSDDEDDEPTPQPKTQPPKPSKETPLPKPYNAKIPYPQSLRKEKMEAQYGKFLDMIRAVRINVPLVDVLARMPNYGKFLKELISNKHKIEQISTAFLRDESFVILQNKVPPKLRDPGTDAVIRVKQKQLNLGVRTERMIFNIDSVIKHSYSNDDTCFSINVIEEILEEDFDSLLDEGSKILHSIEGTILEEEIFSKFDKSIAMAANENYDSESDEEEPKFKKVTINTDYKIKTSLEEPPTDLELKPLPDNLEYAFLEELSFFLLCNASATFQRCMLAIFHDMIEESVEVFMDDFFIFGNSFDKCLNNLDKMLQRCKDAHLVLNWEKCHFMVKEGIMLGQKVSGAGLEVDKAKINVISKLSPPTNIKGVRSFLGHAGFYRHFIKYFSKIARPLTKLHEKDTLFKFDDECRKAFELLKEKLICAPVIVSLNLNLPFELMCDASDFTVGAVLGQKDGKNFHPIYFASKALNPTQQKYTIIEKELMVTSDDSEVDDNFLGEILMEINTRDEPWFEYFANYLVGDIIPKGMTIPKALISSRGTHFFNKMMEKTMKRYGVSHRFSTSYHPQTSVQVENINRALKRILKKTVKDNPVIWSRKLNDARWAFRTAYKTPTGTTPYKLIYGKNYHLPLEIEHRAYWALKNCNPDLIATGEK